MKRKNLVLYSILTAIALANAAVYWSLKPIWFFIDKEIGNIGSIDNFWSIFFWILSTAVCIYTLVLFIIRKSGLVHSVILIFFNLIFIIFNIYLCQMLGSEINILSRNLLTLLPGLLITATVLYFTIIFPKTKLSKNGKSRALAAVLLLLVLFVSINIPGNIRITSGPSIQYIDDDNFAVIWTTNRKSTGWIEWGPDENQLSVKQMSEKGLIQANTRAHKIIMSGNQNDNFIFRAGSKDIKELFQNNVVFGKTVYSEFIEFEDNKYNDEISFYVLSDIHERKDLYEKYLSGNDYDFLVLNGDLLSSVDTEDIIIDEMLKPLSTYSKGFTPFYFVRGNHETRGASARELPDYLALPGDSYYYTFNYGPVFGLVLDAGEDKPDSHEEYGGLADFEAYRETESEWLKDVSQSEAWKKAEFKIVFNHIPLNMYESTQEDSSLRKTEEEWVKILNSIEIDALISGHTHKSDFIEADGDRFKFPIIVGGGYRKANSGYEAIKIEVENDSMKIYLVDEDGQLSEICTIDD
ncbi:MAG: metallophosphoesterase [Spirochaetales bacterium]|nr:metallophosphoesterase [Spirochaetales bacterium]